MSKILGNGKDSTKGSNFDLDTDLSTLNSKLVDETINSRCNVLDASVSKSKEKRYEKARSTTGRYNETALLKP